MRSWSAPGMPTPESTTCTRTSAPSWRADTCTVPPAGVNFTALDSRFSRICLSRSSSAFTGPIPAVTSADSWRFLLVARSRIKPTQCSTTVPTSTGARASSIAPASTLERSSTSLSSSSRCRPDARMSRRYSSCRSLRSPNIRSSSTSEKPMTAFSGVLSSCDMLARNSDLCRLATSSSALRTSSARTRCALRMATAACAANAVSRVVSRSSNGCDLSTPQTQHPDKVVVEQQRRPDRGPEPGHLLRVGPRS